MHIRDVVGLCMTSACSVGSIPCKYSKRPLDGKAVVGASYKFYTTHNRRALWIHTALLQYIFSEQNTEQDTLKHYSDL